jgi:hypothetical protein
VLIIKNCEDSNSKIKIIENKNVVLATTVSIPNKQSTRKQYETSLKTNQLVCECESILIINFCRII